MNTAHRRFLTRRAVATVLASIALTLSSPLLAEEPPGGGSSSTTDIEQAKALLRQGNKSFREGDFVAAEEAYRQAYARRPGYDTAGSLGDALLKLERYSEAAKYLEECVRTLPATVPAAVRDRMTAAYQEARRQVGALRIAVNVSGAELLVDGQLVGTSPLEREVFVNAGQHNVVARWRDESSSASIQVSKGATESATLTFDTGPSMALVVAGGAAGVAGIASGVVFAILSNSKASDAEAARKGSEERMGLRDDQTLFGNISFWSFVGGGAVLAGTAIYALTAGGISGATEEPPSGLRAAPIVMAKGGGLMIGGTW